MGGIGSHTIPNKGDTDSWITPRVVLSELGTFNLDPCQCTPQPWKCAEHGYNIEQDGLSQPWFGRVWLNPPYSTAGQWLKRLAQHGRGTALVFARTETRMFHESVWPVASGLFFFSGRLYFHHPNGQRAKGNSGGPSVLIAYGDEDAQILSNAKLAGTYIRPE